MDIPTTLAISGLSKVYPNGYEALADITFTVQGGEFVCIIGRSGAGKSTLLRCINGLIPATNGVVSLNGTDIASLSERERMQMRRRIGFIFQEYNLVERLTALQNVLSGRLGYLNTWDSLIGYFNLSHREKALACLAQVNMLPRARYRADKLSGGEKQRVAIARALAQEPLLLLADEPVASLDPELTWGIMDDLRHIARKESVPTIVNIHDLETAKHFADRIIGIARGRILFDGPPSSLTNAILREIYRSDNPMMRSRYEILDDLALIENGATNED
jgi:phosphonate transport system ATP-binding protein